MARNFSSTLNFRIGADTAQFLSSMQKMQSSMQSFGRQMQSIGTKLSAVFTAPLAAAGLGAVKLAADVEQVEVAFTTMLGSGEKARALLKDIQGFAASTPFQFPELQKSAKSLLAFGVASENIVPTLRQIGDISAGIGAPIGEIAEIFGKARVQGRLFAEDINQLTGRGIPVIQELAKQFGVAESEVKKLVESGQVNFSNLQKAFADLTSEGGKFAGLMDAQSKTLSGVWSTMVDNISLGLTDLGKDIVETFDLKTTIKNVSDGIGRVVAQFKALTPETKKTLIQVAAFAAAIPPLIAGLGTIITIAPAVGAAFAAMTGPVGLTVAAVAAGAILIIKNWDEIKAYFSTGGGAQVAGLIKNQLEGISDLFLFAGQLIQGNFGGAFDTLFNTVKKRINDIISLVAGFLSKITDLGAVIDEAFGLESFAQINKDISKGIKDFAESIKLDIKDTSGEVDKLKASFSGLIPDELKNLIADTKKFFDDLTKSAEESAAAMTEAFKSPASTSAQGGAAGKFKAPGFLDYSTALNVEGVGDLGIGVPEALANIVQPVENAKKTIKDFAAVIQQDFGAGVNFIAQGAGSIAGSFAELALSGKASFADFAKVVIQTLTRMITQFIAAAAAAFVLKTIIGSLVPGLQSGQLSGFGKFLKGISGILGGGGIPSLDSGGVLLKDSLVNAHKGEIVAPLNRLPQLLGGNGIDVRVTGVIEGENIRISNERSNDRYWRNT